MTTLTELTPAWLQRAADADLVREAMEQTVHAFRPTGPAEIVDVGLSWRLRIGERHWRGTVRVTWRPAAGGPSRLTRVLATLDPGAGATAPRNQQVPFGEPGWAWYLDPLGIALSCAEDEGLPDLPWMTDPDQALPVLVDMLGDARPDLPEIVGCTPEVLRYKLGSRCTVGYDLRTADPDEALPNPVVAKTYAGGKGAVAHEAMEGMWGTDLRRGASMAIAEPLGYDAERRLLLQGPVPGERPLKRMIVEAFSHGGVDLDTLEGLVRSTATGLADVHACGLELGQRRRWQDDLDELLSRRRRAISAVPEVEPFAVDLLDALVRLDSATPPGPDVPSHGSFRAAQVLVSGTDIGFIDFDSFAQAEPALDVAEFAFRLEQLALVKTATVDGPGPGFDRRAAVDRLTAAFLDEYRRHAEVSADRVSLWWAVNALSLVFSSYTKLKLARLPACVELVERAAERGGLPRPR